MSYFFLLLVFQSWMSIVPCPSSAQERDRELYFPSYYFFAERRLMNHTIETLLVKNLDECEYLCYMNDACVSLNIKNPANNGIHECELNNSTHMEHDGDLVDNLIYYYRGAKNNCGKSGSLCENNATCHSGFTPKGYRCLCDPGFESEHCEKVDVCHNYQTLSDAERKQTFQTVSAQCDDTLNGWYRFQGAAGTQMATSCPPMNRCGANFPGWLSGSHPTVAQGKVTRTVCFRKPGNSGCCEESTTIQVKSCGSYYIYKLSDTNGCPMRYCGTD